MTQLTSEALRAPVNVTWEITEACNLSCRHCLSADLRAEGRGELSHGECLAVIDELAAADVFQINFGGGEPFLRDDFLQILDYAHAKGITTCVSTNGTMLTAGQADRLAAMDQLFLQVSLDGVNPETNDAMRGPGTFHRIIAGVELLRSHGVDDISLNMVVTRLNVRQVAAFVMLAKGYGAKPRLSRFRPSGAGCRVWGEYRLTRTQLLELSSFLGEHPEIRTGDSFFALAPATRRENGLTMCGAARMTMSIAPDGGVYPCAFLSDHAFLAGNVRRASPIAIFRESGVFEQLRGMDSASCKDCSRFSLCRGGCPAVAYFVTRSVGSGDPECLRVALGVSG